MKTAIPLLRYAYSLLLLIGLGAANSTAATSLQLGFDPPSAANESNRTAVLTWNAVANLRYRVEVADDLTAWQAMDLVTASNAGPVRWTAPESLRSQKFYRLVLPQPEVFEVQPAFINSSDPAAALFLTGQLLPTNALVVINGQVFNGTNDGSGNLRVGLNGLPPGQPVIGTITVMDAGSNVVATLPVQAPIFYGTTAPPELLQGPPEEPSARPAALLAFWLSKKGYDYYQAKSQLNSAGATHNPYFAENSNVGEIPESLSKRGYDYYQARSDMNAAGLHNNPAFQDHKHQGVMPGAERSAAHPTPSVKKELMNISRVLPASGELQCQATDLVIPGVGLDFAWTRTYRSRTGPTTAQGAGWDFSYNVSLTQNGDGTITLRPGNGRADTFYPTGTNWVRDEYFCEIADLNKDGMPDVLFADTGKWLFKPLGLPAAGKLWQSVDRNGNTMTFNYDVSGRLAEIVDDQGRTNSVSYNVAGQISSVTDFTGRTVRYEYDGNGDLTKVISPAVTGTPTGNDFPGGITNRYTYSSGFTNAAENHLLLSVIDGKGQTQSSHVYQHNQTDLEFLRCVAVQEGTNPPTQYRFFPRLPTHLRGYATGTCIANDPVGNVSETDFDSRGRCVALREFTGRATPGVPVTDTVNRPTKKLRADDPDYFETKWSWNRDSLCTLETLPDGAQTRCVYHQEFGPTGPQKKGDLRVVHSLAAPGGGADLDGDGVNDITELTWHFDYDPRFGSPARKYFIHAIHAGRRGFGIGDADYNPATKKYVDAAARGKKLYVGNLPFAANEASGNFRGPRQTVSLDGSYGFSQMDRLGRPAINTALNSSARAINTKGTGATVRLGVGKVNQTAGEECDDAYNFCVSVTDPRGNVTLADYDDHGNCLRLRKRPELLYQSWDGRLASFGYNSYGQLTDFTNAPDANGRYYWERHVYSDDPFTTRVAPITTVADADGLRLTNRFEYDARGNVTRSIGPLGYDWRFTYNALDQLVRCETPTNLTARSKTDFIYDRSQNVQDAIEELRDDNDAFVHNVTTSCQYDDLNRCTAVVAQVSPGVFVTNKFSYDANHQLTLAQSPLAVSGGDPHAATAFEYDERGLLFREVGAPGSPLQITTQFDYDAVLALTRITTGIEGSPAVTTFEHDGFSQLWVETVWNKQCIEKDTTVRLTRVIDPMGNITTFNYDANSNLKLVRHYGELKDVPGTNGNVLLAQTAFTYDGLDRLVTQRDAHFSVIGQTIGDGYRTTSFAYAPNGSCTSVTDDLGRVTSFYYDTAGRGTNVTSPDQRTSFAILLNGRGEPTQCIQTDRSDLPGPVQVFVRTNVFDSLGRCVQSVDNVGNTNRATYDSFGNLRRQEDPDGRTVWWVYDDLSRCTLNVADLNGDGVADLAVDVNQSYSYDDNSRLVAMADDNTNTTSVAYDSLDHPTQLTLADGTHRSLIWSPRSNLILQQDANGTVISNAFDQLDRCVARTITPGAGVADTTTFTRYAYDGLSRTVAATNNASHSEFTFDSLGNCTASSHNGWLLGHLNDALGRSLAVTNSSGRIVTYAYNSLDQITNVSSSPGAGQPFTTLATMDYDGPGRVARIVRANGINTRISWNGLAGVANAAGDFGWQQVSGINHQVAGGGAVIDRRVMSYDRKQNKTSRRQIAPFTQGQPMLTNTWSHDALNRITASFHVKPTQITDVYEFTLDGNGNRQVVTSNGVARPYVMDATPLPGPADFQMNQYTVTPFAAQTFDENGNQLSHTSSAKQLMYEYDYADRLVSVVDVTTGSAVPVASYAYGPFGERVSKTVFSSNPLAPPTVTEYIRDFTHGEVCDDGNMDSGDGCSTEVRVNGAFVDSYIHRTDDGVWFFRFHNSAAQHYICDELGNTLALTDSGGGVIERFDYGDFGEPRFLNSIGLPTGTNSSPAGNPFLFHGREWDAETGLYAGSFDPQTGRDNSGGNSTRAGISTSRSNLRQKNGLFSGENPWSGGGDDTPGMRAGISTSRSNIRDKSKFHDGGNSGDNSSKLPRNILKTFFETGDKPTPAQFGALIDSTVNFAEDRDLLGLRSYGKAHELRGHVTLIK